MVSVRSGVGGEASYDILIGRGLLAELPALLATHCPSSTYVVISDSHVAPRYGESVVAGLRKAGHTTLLLTFPAGEWNKTRETWSALSDRLVDAHVDRGGVVIALGLSLIHI